MGRAHEKKQTGCFFDAKNQKNLYTRVQIGNTIISRINRQQIDLKIRHSIVHIWIYQKDFSSIDTEKFTASFEGWLHDI